jgi:hypothetical protein
MTVQELREELKYISDDKVVIITEPDGLGWTNVSEIEEDEGCVKIIQDNKPLFD